MQGLASGPGQFATRWLDDTGKRRNHICITCDHEWPCEDRYLWWPLRLTVVNPWRHRWQHEGPGGGWRGCLRYGLHDLGFAWYWQPGQWGVEVGSDSQWRRLFSRHWGWALVRVHFGPKHLPERTERVCPACGVLFWRREAV